MTRASRQSSLRRWTARHAVPVLVALAVGAGIGALIGRSMDAPPTAVPPPVSKAPDSKAPDSVKPPAAKAPAVEPRFGEATPKPATPRQESAWKRHAMPDPATGARPMIAVVIDDLGMDRVRSARAADLRAPLTLSWLAYAPDLPAQTAHAHAAGHELLVHLPMQPLSADADPGPRTLTTEADAATNLRNLQWALGRFEGYVGVNNHMGSRFTADGTALRPILAEVGRRGLLFLDSRTTAESVVIPLARGLGLPHAGRDVFLDDDGAPDAIRARLAETEAIARRNGYVVAIGHPRDATLAALAAWLPEVERRGFVLVPLSAVVRRNGGVGG